MFLDIGDFILSYYPLFIYVLVFGLISYFITLFIIKKNKRMFLVIPIVFFILTIILGGSAFLADDWGALGYLILALLAGGGFLSSLVSSLIIYFTKIKD
ncbi:MAG: hypothetical protein AB7E16_02010 [Candidatus Izemoplasmatales bacterium]|jgi:amino acid transporter